MCLPKGNSNCDLIEILIQFQFSMDYKFTVSIGEFCVSCMCFHDCMFCMHSAWCQCVWFCKIFAIFIVKRKYTHRKSDTDRNHSCTHVISLFGYMIQLVNVIFVWYTRYGAHDQMQLHIETESRKPKIFNKQLRDWPTLIVCIVCEMVT